MSIQRRTRKLSLPEKKRSSFSVALLVTALLSACGTHTTLDEEAPKQSSAGAAAPSGTQAGRTAAVGSTASTASPAPTAAPVPCGSKQCPAPTSLLTMILGAPVSVACCADAATGTCGAAASAGAVCERAPTADARCPGVDLSVLSSFVDLSSAPIGNTKVGCCTPKGMCGSDGTAFGRGCVENGEASLLLSAVPLVGGLVPIPGARQCEQAELDAGM